MTEPEIQLARYAIALLEAIACNNRSAVGMEVEEYLGRIQVACGVKKEEIFRGFRQEVKVEQVSTGQKKGK